MQEEVVQNQQIIDSFEKQIDIFINEFTEKEITNAALSKFFDKVINNLSNNKLINDTVFDIYYGKQIITKPFKPDFTTFSQQNYDENWQKFYSFNRDIMIENTIGFISKNLKKASIKDKLYYSFAKLSEQLDLTAVSDYFMKKIDNYIIFDKV
ncbi:MAG TPA: hypothetical protein LFW21_07550 [Rickettsia endosymbiont of Pyrocoelia pectoralis]|nr:hypothetical protein [Rickettsia endosymbiont of Pyrocoelia pectoralis]